MQSIGGLEDRNMNFVLTFYKFRTFLKCNLKKYGDFLNVF